MRPIFKRLFVTALISLALGILAIVPVVTSDNGYVAGYAFFPLFVLIGLVAFVLFVVGLATVTKKSGAPLLIAAVCLPAGFMGGGIVSKQLKLGAYREEPMSPIVPRMANKVVFKKDATHDEIQKFWSEVVSDRVGASGEKTRPGIQGMSSNPSEDGHEVVTFSFFSSATETEIADVRARVLAYPAVYQYLENVDTSAPVPLESKPVNDNSATPVKKGKTFRYEQ